MGEFYNMAVLMRVSSRRKETATACAVAVLVGAANRIRTDDLPLTRRLLYQLSYGGEKLVQTLKTLDIANDAVRCSSESGAIIQTVSNFSSFSVA